MKWLQSLPAAVRTNYRKILGLAAFVATYVVLSLCIPMDGAVRDNAGGGLAVIILAALADTWLIVKGYGLIFRLRPSKKRADQAGTPA